LGRKSQNYGGGWQAVSYVLKMGWRVGPRYLWKSMRSRNACKTCALGMGGQMGGMRNEQGRFPEVCKKSVQAMISDMQGAIKNQFFARYSLQQLQAFTPRELETSGRIGTPLYLAGGAGHYQPISWEQAFEKIAAKLKVTKPERSFFYFSGRSSNEAGFLLQLFARLFGTNHVNNCSFYCHQASGVGLGETLGTSTATITLEDLEHCDLFFLIGANPSSNHPRLMTMLKDLRRRGGHVIVINPLREKGLENFRVPSDPRSMVFGSKIASHYLQIKAGGDIALMHGIAKVLLEKQAVAFDFIANATEGWNDFRQLVEAESWDEIEKHAGVSRADIVHVADHYIRAKNVVFGWCMGITHHEHGVANVQTIVNLALMRGMVGRPHAGLLPIRGHSNVQGMGSMNVSPQLKAEVFKRIEALGCSLPTFTGYDTMACMEAAARREMDFGFCLGGNLFGSNPDANFAESAMRNLGMAVYLSTTLNTGHVRGLAKETLILPVYARDEDPQKTTQESMFNYVRLSDGGDERHPGLKTEVEIISEIAARVLGDLGIVNWTEMRNHRNIRQLIAQIIPGFEPLKAIDDTKKEFQIAGRTFQSAKFPTGSGKAKFTSHKIPIIPGTAATMNLITLRSEGQFNTVVYEDFDLYRGQERRDVILMNRRDMDRLQLKRDQKVKVKSEIGEMANILVREFDISEGSVAMYYPEVNRIVGRRVDPKSKTPAFKSMPVEILSNFSS
jgi:molybdopterin-dependent oxidoreductase alpha subunit